MSPNERQDEVLEAIWVASEKKEYSIEAIKKECAVSLSEEDLAELEKQNLLIKSGDKILFSHAGKGLAEQIIRRHRLAEVLLHSILKLKSAEMEEIACKVEHTLLPEIEESICTLLGHPELAPDNSPIPAGKCCGQKRRTVDSVVSALSELHAGETAKVMYIRPSNHSQLHQLLSFGLNPGVVLEVHQTSPAFCITFENTELALDKTTAGNIFVLRTKTS
ncbi:metal-dependent transcriptional regulator [Bdellovibrionota bacterium FG-1]